MTDRNSEHKAPFMPWQILGAFVLFLITIPITTLTTGTLVQNGFGRDTITFLDMGWRVLQGQIPHVDYHSPLGILFHLELGGAMFICGVSAKALMYLTLFMFILLTIWSFWISSRRMTPLCALLATCSVGVVTAGAYYLGCPFQATTYGGLYNRFCFAMIFIIIIEQYFPPLDRDRVNSTAAGFSTGALLAGLFFTKLPFFIVAAGSIILRAILEPQGKKWGAGFSVGIVSVALPLLIKLRFMIGAMIDDCTINGRVQGAHLFTNVENLLSKFLPSAWEIAAILALCSALPRISWQWSRRTISKKFVWIVTLYFILCAAALHLTNFGDKEMLLLGMIPFFLWQYLQRGSGVIGHKKNMFFVLVAACFLLVNAPFFYRNLASLSYARECKDAVLFSVPRFDSSTLSDLFIRPKDDRDDISSVGKINDGIALLRKNINQDDRIIALDFDNPFSVALLQKSPRGDSIHYENNFNFNDKIFWKPEHLFQDTTVIIVQKSYDPIATGPLITLYKSYIKSNFEKRDESTYWVLFMRRR